MITMSWCYHLKYLTKLVLRYHPFAQHCFKHASVVVKNIVTTHPLYDSETIIHVRYEDDDVTDKKKNIRSSDIT
jgi:hypothetical protein